jgi:hypothetical protein
MKRRHRIFVTLPAIAALIFAQAAASFHACSGPVADPVAMAQMKAGMGDDGGLCEKHCSDATMSFEAAKPSFSAMTAVVAVPLRVSFVEPVGLHAHQRAARLPIAGPAPPLIRFTVLRI